MKGSIELARTICEELKGELPDGEQYGSVQVAEILSAYIRRLEDQRDNFEALYLGSGGSRDAARYAARRDEEYMKLLQGLNGETTDRSQHAASYDAHSDWLAKALLHPESK